MNYTVILSLLCGLLTAVAAIVDVASYAHHFFKWWILDIFLFCIGVAVVLFEVVFPPKCRELYYLMLRSHVLLLKIRILRLLAWKRDSFHTVRLSVCICCVIAHQCWSLDSQS